MTDPTTVRLQQSVKRLSYLAIDKGYGVWRCVKCDTRYTTFPSPQSVCGECQGRLEPFVPEQPLEKENARLKKALEGVVKFAALGVAAFREKNEKLAPGRHDALDEWADRKLVEAEALVVTREEPPRV